jgi:hypothetical protein
MNGLPEGVLLFLDLASPPLIASYSRDCYFFTGGHPLTRYLSQVWRPLPEVDTSGANVTYAAVSLAEKLGALSIELYGADFSYPLGLSYARGTYIHPYFEKDQNRLSPLEQKASAFLFRGPLEKVYKENGGWYYQSRSLSFYRQRLEEKCRSLEAELIPQEGQGPRLAAGLSLAAGPKPREHLRLFSPGAPKMKARDFLAHYRERIASLPAFQKDVSRYLRNLNAENYAVLTTLLPAAAALKRRNPRMEAAELLEADRAYSLKEIDRVLSEPVSKVQ